LRGYRVSSAMNVTAALELASNEDFDLLLSDLGLPDGSPEPVMKKVAARNGTVGVALSGFGMEKDIEMSRGFGFSHHLVKPVDVGRLMEILEQCGEEARAGCR
jgi:CheY-like chemotaxis protein